MSIFSFAVGRYTILTYMLSAILGFVQGVAEFLPISSSGHLTLFQHFFGLQEPDTGGISGK